MASKQFGKLRQWAGEKIASEKKTVATDAFKDLETEVERRRSGMEQIYETSQSYYRYLVKKKDGPDNEQKLLPMEMLGRVMVAHGEEFGTDSAYGHALCALGRVHTDVASYQEQFAETFHASFLTRVEACLAEVAQYHVLRKKLKSRRLAYDAAVSHAQKQFKKEKEKSDAEEEVVRARTRFEEMSTEVQAQMEKIQDGEMDQFKDLGSLLDMELKFAESWANALREVKDDWPEDTEVHRVTPNRPKGPTHVLRPTTPAESAPISADDTPSSESDNPKRPTHQHKRSTSIVTSGSQGRKSTVTNWASSLLGKGKSADFAELNGDDSTDPNTPIVKSQAEGASTLTRTRSGKAAPPPPRSRAQSTHSSKHNSPRQSMRNLPSEKLASQKIMRALYAFKGKEDELTMEVGDEIIVLSEPTEMWWLGESKGLKGLFPVNYTEEAPKKPPLPARPSALARSSQSTPTSPLQEFPTLRARSNSATVKRKAEDEWRDEPFGDHHSALSPIHSPDYRQASHSTQADDSSDDDERGLMDTPRDENAKNGEAARAGVVRQLSRSLSGKKAPPPPPPSRRTNSTSIHRISSSGPNTGSPFLTPTTANAEWGSKNDTKSPFDEGEAEPFSAGSTFDGRRESFDRGGSTSDLSLSNQKCRICDCDDFQQSLFRTDGYCNSCFHRHAS